MAMYRLLGLRMSCLWTGRRIFQRVNEKASKAKISHSWKETITRALDKPKKRSEVLTAEVSTGSKYLYKKSFQGLTTGHCALIKGHTLDVVEETRRYKEETHRHLLTSCDAVFKKRNRAKTWIVSIFWKKFNSKASWDVWGWRTAVEKGAHGNLLVEVHKYSIFFHRQKGHKLTFP